jgi:hypothetical protein
MSDSATNQGDFILIGHAIGMERNASIGYKAGIDPKIDPGEGSVGSANNGGK